MEHIRGPLRHLYSVKVQQFMVETLKRLAYPLGYAGLAGAAGMLLQLNGKFTMSKPKSPILS